MPTAITTVDQLLQSARFLMATNNRTYTDEEKENINTLFLYMLNNKISIFDSSVYMTFTNLVAYDVDNLVDRYLLIRKNPRKLSLEMSIARHGSVEGTKRWDSYVNKQRTKNLFEATQEKYGWTKEQFKEFNNSRAVTLEKCIARHGDVKGQKIWEGYLEKQKYTNSIEYYNEKYGDAGYVEWLKYNAEKGKSSKLDWIMEKYNVDEDGALKIASDRHPKSHSSAAELHFVNALEKAIGETLPYTAKTKQFSIWNTYTNSIKFYDVVDTKRKKIIEFHGDYWHCNPKKYNESFIHAHSQHTAKEIWQEDFLKTKVAIDRGFSVKIVWWSDYEESPEQTINEVKKWLNSN